MSLGNQMISCFISEVINQTINQSICLLDTAMIFRCCEIVFQWDAPEQCDNETMAQQKQNAASSLWWVWPVQ